MFVRPDVTGRLVSIWSLLATLVGVHPRSAVKDALDLAVLQRNCIDSGTVRSQLIGPGRATVVSQQCLGQCEHRSQQ